MQKLYPILVVGLLAISASANAQTRDRTQTQAQPQAQDRSADTQRPGTAAADFVNKAAIGDMYEIRSSRLALEKVAAGETKEFAQRIVADHTKSSEELKSLAQRLQGVKIPTELDTQHLQKLDRLKSASAAEFASLYRSQQIEAHNTAIRLFEQYAQNGQQPELKQFAERTLPTLREHLQMAQSLPQRPAALGQAPSAAAQRTAQSTQVQSGQQQGAGAPAAQQSNTPAASRTRQVISRLGPEHMLASDLLDTNIYGTNGEDIGEVDDVVIGPDGRVVAVVVGVGGFLGIGQKDVAIPFSALEISAAEGQQADRTNRQTGTKNPNRVILRHMSRQELESAPSFNEDQ
jgi:putative membrane protein